MIDPLIGTWELDPSTLNYESGRPGKRATYVIEAIPNGPLFLLDGEDGEGRPIKFQYGGPTDGSGQPLPGDSGLVLVLKRDCERTIESVLKRGEVVLDRWTRELDVVIVLARPILGHRRHDVFCPLPAIRRIVRYAARCFPGSQSGVSFVYAGNRTHRQHGCTVSRK
jgi:hypothetical protein